MPVSPSGEHMLKVPSLLSERGELASPIAQPQPRQLQLRLQPWLLLVPSQRVVRPDVLPAEVLGTMRGCFPDDFSPLLSIILPCGAARTCVRFHSSGVTKGTQISPGNFSPQLFLKAEFPPTPYTESFCLLVTVNGNPSRIHDNVFL